MSVLLLGMDVPHFGPEVNAEFVADLLVRVLNQSREIDAKPITIDLDPGPQWRDLQEEMQTESTCCPVCDAKLNVWAWRGQLGVGYQPVKAPHLRLVDAAAPQPLVAEMSEQIAASGPFAGLIIDRGIGIVYPADREPLPLHTRLIVFIDPDQSLRDGTPGGDDDG
jgi:hypothetical protein